MIFQNCVATSAAKHHKRDKCQRLSLEGRKEGRKEGRERRNEGGRERRRGREGGRKVKKKKGEISNLRKNKNKTKD